MEWHKKEITAEDKRCHHVTRGVVMGERPNDIHIGFWRCPSGGHPRKYMV
jgi:hypothetical protein